MLQSDAKPTPLVLAIASDPRMRRELAAALAPEFSVLEVEPAGLAAPARLLDAAAAIVCLGAEDDAETLASLRALRALPVRASVVLALGALPDALVESALAELEPVQVVARPGSALLLRWAVARALHSPTPGRGARSQQRRTPALLGVSGAIRQVLDQVKQVAPSQIPVLILGETGTGKELVARAIHEQSLRAGAPFVAVNCGALPDSLLESELFGHRRGAFTGADHDKTGLFEVADGGTIFLDEIGDTTPALQMKLLRVIETRELRQDLYYRLNAVTIYVPPLRRRRVDIPFLAQHFAEELGVEQARSIALDEKFLDALSQREFPGNVRELRNAVERAITLAAPDEPITTRHLVPESHALSPEPLPQWSTLRERVERVEAQAIREALESCGGNRRKMAEALGLSRPGLRYKMRRLGLDSSDEK